MRHVNYMTAQRWEDFTCFLVDGSSLSLTIKLKNAFGLLLLFHGNSTMTFTLQVQRDNDLVLNTRLRILAPILANHL